MEGGRWGVLESVHHEVAEHRSSDVPARFVVPETVGVVITDINTRDQIWRETDKPGIAKVVRGAGLAGDWLADGFNSHAGPPLDDTLHHRHDLEGGAGIGDLCARVGEHRDWLLFP